MRCLLQGTTLASSTSVDKRVIRIGSINFEHTRIIYSSLLPAPKDIAAALGVITSFEFHIWNSLELVQAPSSTGAAHSNFHVDADASVAGLPVSSTSAGVEKHPDVNIVHAVPKALAEPDVILTEGAQSFSSVLEQDCVETVDLAAPNADVVDTKVEAFYDSKTQSWHHSAVKIVAQLGQITENPYQHGASLDPKNRIKSSIQVMGCDYILGVLECIVEVYTSQVWEDVHQLSVATHTIVSSPRSCSCRLTAPLPRFSGAVQKTSIGSLVVQPSSYVAFDMQKYARLKILYDVLVSRSQKRHLILIAKHFRKRKNCEDGVLKVWCNGTKPERLSCCCMCPRTEVFRRSGGLVRYRDHILSRTYAANQRSWNNAVAYVGRSSLLHQLGVSEEPISYNCIAEHSRPVREHIVFRLHCNLLRHPATVPFTTNRVPHFSPVTFAHKNQNYYGSECIW